MFKAMTQHSNELASVHLAIAGYRTSGTRIPIANNIHDLGQLPSGDVPTLLNSLDLAIIYNRKSLFGEFCFPQKFYEILACQIPVVAANVGEIGILLNDKPHLLYEDGNVASLISAIRQQLAERELLDLVIPTWHDQASLLGQQIESARASA
jgi:glycosyltransferase involved in cell wall biosynthesis